MKTIVAVTCQNKKSIFDHAGKCRNFLMYTINEDIVESKQFIELSKEETLHSLFQEENNSKKNILLDVDILLTCGIGNKAIQNLAKYNVACYKIEETDPDKAIHQLINGTLEAMTPVSHSVSGCSCNCKNHNYRNN